MAPEREARSPKARPDPGPMRLAIGASGLAALAAMATAIALPAPPAPPMAAALDGSPAPTPAAPLVIKHVTRYVRLRPGETAPPGAPVVAQPDPSPRVVVVTITAPPQPAVVRRVVVVTRQSGTK
jgi:hypothetical protein